MADVEKRDLEDSEASTTEAFFDFSRFDRSMFGNPMVQRACGVIAIASLVVFWPERSGRVLVLLLGLGLLVVSATSAFAALRASPRQWVRLLTAIASGIAGVLLVASPERSDNFLGRLLAIIIIVTAVRYWLADRRLEQAADNTLWMVARTLAMVAAAGLLFLFPNQLFSAVITAVAVGWIVVSALVLRISLDRNYEGAATYTDSGQLIIDWLTAQPKSVDDRQALYNKILYDGPGGKRRIPRFFTLMSFAAVIASMGVITDSTAVVIGAMLIAPLMTPLMGMAISLVMGWPRRLGHSAVMAIGGISLAIAIGLLLGLVAPTVIDTSTNTQILSRATPTLLDLITATAAGAAGAYGLSRPDVSDALPGVAIAISLVPPLTVVGIAYSQGDWGAGNGALLLFGTNMLAILVVGGLTFVVTGVAPIQRLADNQHRVRTAAAGLVALGAMVVGSLMLNSAQITENLLEESSVQQAIDEWIEPYSDHDVVVANITGDTVSVTIVGPANNAPTAADLAAGLSRRLNRPTTADVRLLVQERDIATSGEGG